LNQNYKVQKTKSPELEEDEEEDEEDISRASSPDGHDSQDQEYDIDAEIDVKKMYRNIKGVVPKDLESKKEIMSFIAYPFHLENACKLISCNK
jgi:hypothetical protein